MRMMISVVSVAEARDALQGGAEILDIKNPAEGSLGAQPPGLIKEITQLFSAEAEISAAIGDMPNLPGTAALAALGAAVCGVHYVKVGLLGPHTEADAIALLREVRLAVRGFRGFREFPEFPGFNTKIIAALFADYRRAGALNPECLPRIAAAAGVHGCLVDTAIKDGYSLFDFIEPQALRLIGEQAHAQGLSFALAGSLREEHLPLVNTLGADIAGIRTAVCKDNRRDGPLDPALVKKLCSNELIRANS